GSMTREAILKPQGMRTAARPNPLLMVLVWELRRLGAGRFGWLAAVVVFCCFAGGVALRFRFVLTDTTFLLGTTAFGQLAVMVYNLMPVFGVILPFVSADGVARDYHQRVHELLMTTTMPAWAYIAGRYLAALLVGLGIAALLISAQVTANAALALLDSR